MSPKNWESWALGSGVIGCALVAWLVGGRLSSGGADLWVLRGGLAALGFTGIAALWRWRRPARASTGGPATDAAEPARDEVESFIAEAESNLGRKIATAPVMLVLGQAGSGKTSVVLHSGLEAQAIAGQWTGTHSSQESGQSHLWVIGETLLLETASHLISAAKPWGRLARHIAPGRLRAAMAKSAQPPRAAIVCVDLEQFSQENAAASTLEVARNLRNRLKELCHTLGADIPVYVLFTKLDRAKFFSDYAKNLSKEEAGRPLGVTLPMEGHQAGAVWADWQSGRIKRALDELFYVLAERCLELVSMESDQTQRRGAYQFPREFRKIRQQGTIIQFLVDLCRPYQLGSAPFLRGFYFTGTRESTGTPLPDVETRRPEPREDYDPTATRIALGSGMSRDPLQSRPSLTPSGPMGKEWVFLARLFSQVLLPDRMALSVSASSTKVTFWRRVALAAAALILLCMAAGATVSYFGNRELALRAFTASEALRSSTLKPSAAISDDALKSLDDLRQLLVQLGQWHIGREPLSLKWGLYNDLYPDVRRTYFDQFGRLMFFLVRTDWRDTLLSLNGGPQKTEDFSPAYDTLKAYLMATARPDKSTRDFLSPMLLRSWEKGQNVDAERRRLARLQFEFFIDQQHADPPYPQLGEDEAVKKSRGFLEQFEAVEPVYKRMIAEAGKQRAAVNFAQQFPGSEETVVDKYEVPGQYTNAGWPVMQKLLRNPEEFLPNEEWVVKVPAADLAKIKQDLPARYQGVFIDHWTKFLESAQVVGCKRPAEATRKLAVLSGSQSPLLQLFCVVSQNVSVDSPQVKDAFLPVQSVVPPDCMKKLSGDANSGYTNALYALYQAFQEVPDNPKQGDPQSQIPAKLRAAKASVHEMETGFPNEPGGKVSKSLTRLLNAPISAAEHCVPSAADASGVCSELRAVAVKYPFKPTGKDATLAELNALFSPANGSIWKFVERDLNGLVSLQGSHYVATSGAQRVQPEFLTFLDRALRIRNSLYAGSGPEPRLRYSIRAILPDGIKSVTLTADGTTSVFTDKSNEPKDYTWPGNHEGVKLSTEPAAGMGPPAKIQKDIWGIFHLLGDMKWAQESGPEQVLEWPIRASYAAEPFSINGKPVILRFGLTPASAAVFNPANWHGIECSPKAIQ